MRAPYSRPSLIISPISRVRPSMELNASLSPGAVASTGRSSRSCRSRRWLSQFISPILSGSPCSIDNFLRYRFCSCSKVACCMFRFARSGHGCPSSALATRVLGVPPRHFLRDKGDFSSKKTPMFRVGLVALLILSGAPILSATNVVELPNRVVISVKEQKLMLLQNGAKVVTYPISTSKFGVGDDRGRMTTPLGLMQVAKKIGDGAPNGAVFHNRRWTGEILKPNAPGRDPITTRIIWLRGLEVRNAHAFNRWIYIHGSPEEKTIGRPASYGCIRMKGRDVAALYNQLPLGAMVQIVPDRLPRARKIRAGAGAATDSIAPLPPQPKAVLRVASSGRGT